MGRRDWLASVPSDPGPVQCGGCNGTGTIPHGKDETTCPSCNGTGEIYVGD